MRAHDPRAPSRDAGSIGTDREAAFVNLGLIPYFRNTVVFDVERGLVGFGRCS